MSVADKLIAWQKTNGRNDLPWQVRDPYARWVSETMLQQTQVATVIGYYERFMRRFPDVGELARADLDEVMALWAGLGYYSRAKHLHEAAQIIVSQWGGCFPDNEAELALLPGIGPSTAAAVAAFSFGRQAAIFDGNVKRVFARLTGFEADIDVPKNSKALFEIVRAAVPAKDVETYTQAVMDLGALVCKKEPCCELCPLAADCVGAARGVAARLPVRTKKIIRPVKDRTFLIFWCDETFYREKQNQKGVWRNLYVLPSFDGKLAEDSVILKAKDVFSDAMNARFIESFTHDFTHYRLQMHVWAVKTRQIHPGYVKASNIQGMPTPILKVLTRFFAKRG